MTRYRAGALAWLLSAVILPIQVIVAIGWPGGYSWSRNAISDLGVTTCGEFSDVGQQVREVCSPWHAVFTLGLIASGALIVLGAVLLTGFWGRVAGRAGTVAMVVVGVSVIAVGLSPWDSAPAAHDGFALSQAAAQWIAMVLLAVAAGAGRFRRVTVATVVVSVASFAVFLAALEGYEVPGIGFGGIERLAFDSLTIWTAATGAAVLLTRSAPE